MPRNKKTPQKSQNAVINSWLIKTRSAKKLSDASKHDLKIVNQETTNIRRPKRNYKQSLLTNWVSSSGLNSSETNSTCATCHTTTKLPSLPTKKKSPLEIGINLRLHIPGLLDILLPIPAPEHESKNKWVNDMFQNFENKYWTKINDGRRLKYKCLICDEGFSEQFSISSHLAKHIGLRLARCTTCSREFHNIVTAGTHLAKNEKCKV